MRRRTLIAMAGALVIFRHQAALARSIPTDTAFQRMAQAALLELDSDTLVGLRTLGESAGRLAPEAVRNAIAADFRARRTVIVGRVLLSRHEVALALSLSLDENRHR